MACRRWMVAMAAALVTLPGPVTAATTDVVLVGGVVPFSFRYLVFTPDDREVIAFGFDGGVRAYDARTGRLGQTLWLPRGLAGGRFDAADVSPDGRRLAVPAGDRVLVIDRLAARVECVLRGHTGAVVDLAYSPDGKTIATAGFDRTLRLWEAGTGRARATFPGVGRREFTALAWAPDGRTVATAELDGPVRLWDVATGRARDLTLDPVHAHKLLWRPDGRAVALLDHPHPWQVVDLTGAVLLRDDSMRASLAAARFDRQGRLAVPPARGREEDFRLTPAGAAPGRPRVGEGVAVSAGGDLFAHYGAAGEIVVRSLADGTVRVRTAVPEREYPADVGWTADGRSLVWTATRLADRERKTVRSLHLTELTLGRPAAGAARTAAVRKDETRAITAAGDYGYTLTRRDGNTVSLEPGRTADDFLVRGVTLLAGERAAVASDWGLALHDTTTGRELFQYRAAGTGWELAPSPDGRLFVTDGLISVFSAAGPGRLLAVHAAGEGWVAWTEEGYYAARWDGDLPVGRFVERGRDELAEFVPLNRVAGRERPDVIRRLVTAGGVAEALRQAGAVPTP